MKRPDSPQGPWTIHLDVNPLRHQAAWYRWEFLRRNREYQRDYEKFISRFGDFFRRKGFWNSEARTLYWKRRDEDYFYSEINPILDSICEKWQISDLYPPEWRFRKSDGRRKFERDTAYLPTDPGSKVERMLQLWPMGFTGKGGSARRFSKYLVLEFDLTWPIKDMVDYAKRALSHAQSSYLEELEELGIPQPKSRRRLADYDLHLRIWDLKQQGKSVPEIAKLVFPTELHAIGKSAAIQKVRDHISAAEKLIRGQYKEIR